MLKLKSIFILVITLGLVACGDSDSSSEDSGMDDSVQSMVTYSGTQSLILSSNGVSDTTEIEASVTISGDEILIDPLSASGSVADDEFVAITNRTSTYEGLTCQFLLTYRGTISDQTVSGNISGTAKCDDNDDDQDVIGTISALRD